MSAPGDLDGGLNLVVLAKFTVDVNQLGVDPATGGPDLDRAPWNISDSDECAIEEAVSLKERHGGRALGLTLRTGAEIPRDLLLRALAMGLDGFYVLADGRGGNVEPRHTAERLAAGVLYLEQEEFGKPSDLVLAGESSVDGCHGQVGPRVAEALGRPSITDLTQARLHEGVLRAERMLEQRIEVVECAVPALVSVRMESNSPRLPTVLQVMGAGRKPIVELRTEQVGMPSEAAVSGITEVHRLFAPPSRRRRCVIDGTDATSMVADLLARLAREGELPQ